ncbi:MFS transporter [Reinekea blandensis]|uniref:Major facilitator superfamily MFS_1 n=1 Tax=Reinekea blandensis MED297 TaxID=314283 RepID=A4BEE3_9GAMM|nr:MFS transporter [Reinekea blandensis]EAR09621.1 Major facilitator superfamily MFS_1 [Reinekea blandensis MED297]
MSFNSIERKALTGLSLLYASRMLGLFMVLPILTLYGQDLQDASPASLGLALGIYGLTQAFLQIPFGAASDRYGRKPLIVIGLLLFMVGSIVAAMADSVTSLIIGRALQGGGAISSVVLALLADYTREDQRSKSMAVIGAVIGASFVVAVMLGPWIAGFGGLSGLFWFTSALALAGLVITFWLPAVPSLQVHKERQFRPADLWDVLTDRNVTILSLGIFLLHMTMTALFVALPVVLVARGFASDGLGQIYAPVMILSFIGMAPLMMISERRLAQVQFLRLAAGIVIGALLLLWQVPQWAASAVALLIFFVGFNFMEATLPSLLSRKARAQVRGTSMGVFSTAQFTGAAAGGAVGGLLFSDMAFGPVVFLGVAAQAIWLLSLFAVTPVSRANKDPEPVGGQSQADA